MSKVDIIHVVPRLFPYGGYGMMSELHYAFNKYYKHKICEQRIITLDIDDPWEGFVLPWEHVCVKKIDKYLRKQFSNPVVLFHKLASSDARPLREAIYGKVPLIIINHTQADRFRGMGKANAIVSVSKYMHKKMQQQLPKMRIEFIRNGVNACRYEGIPAYKPEQVHGYFVTGRMNNFTPGKHARDWPHFIRTMALRLPVWHDYLGTGRMYALARKGAKNPIRRVTKNVVNLPGRINDFETKVGYIKRWHCFLYEIPNHEGTSMSLLEAMACGVPCIINDRYGNKEIIKKRINGFVCRDRPAMRSRITELMNKETRKQMSRETKKYFLSHFDAEHTAKNYINLIDDVLEKF